jgi:two-component system response regulator NreC
MFFEGSEPTNILLVGNHFKEEEIITAFQHGVKGYILTTCIQEQLIDAIETVSHNDEWWSPEVTFKMLHMATSRNIARVAKPACSQIITQRELEILGLMVRGHNNTEISDLLSLSIYTVQNHICSIYSKLGIRERLKVVHYAIQNGLVEV